MTKNRLYPLTLRTNAYDYVMAYKAKSEDQSWLWHLRYGHLYFGGLNLLHKKKMVRGLPSIEQPTSSCQSYILATHHG